MVLKVLLHHLTEEALLDARDFCFYTLFLILNEVFACKLVSGREKIVK